MTQKRTSTGNKSVSQKTPKKEVEITSMADLLAKYTVKSKGFSVGEKVTGTVIAKTNKTLVLDIGGKSEGIVAEKAFLEARDFIRSLKVGDTVNGQVIVTETPDGYTIVSLRNSIRDFVWQKIEQAKEADEEIMVVVKSSNPAGLLVDAFSLLAFIPLSQLGVEMSKNPAAFIGKSISVKVIDADRNTNRVILSERAVSEKNLVREEKKALGELKTGAVYEGVVTTVSDFGVFVRIIAGDGKKTSLEGLAHISELSWQKIARPADLFSVGDKVKTVVLDVHGSKLSLSLKQAQKDPWEKAANKYKPDDKVSGIVTKISDFGVFVSLEAGLEGLIHITKIPPAVKYHINDKIDCLIEEVNSAEKRISLSPILTAKPLGYK